MKCIVLFACLTLAFAAQVPAKDPVEGAAEAAVETPEGQKYVRYLPADVLRDYPGVCFSSTALDFFEPGQGWPLSPYCGSARCLQEPNGLLVEEVEDCGPPPLENTCTVTNEQDAKAAFPLCCRKYECPPGETLKYPAPITHGPEGPAVDAEAAVAPDAQPATTQ